MSTKNAPRRQRKIQNQVARADKKHPKKKGAQAMQAGARKYPTPPFPGNIRQARLGGHLDPPPMYDAPFYIGSRKLENRIALITGGDSGIGRAVAILFAREGADIAIVYLNEHEDAKVTKAKHRSRRQAMHTDRRRRLPAEILREGRRADSQGVRRTSRPRQQCRLPDSHGEVRRPDCEAFRRDAQDQSVRLFLHGAGSCETNETGSRHRQYRFCDRPARKRIAARLFHDEGRYSRFHPFARHATGSARHPGERCRARPCLDAAQSFGQGSEATSANSGRTRR